MTSVVRSFAQRDTNVISVTPVLKTSGNWNGYNALTIDPRYASVFNVDLSGVTTDTVTISNRVDVQGQLGTYTSKPIVYTYLDIDPKLASVYPGLEFTVNFNWSNGVDFFTYISLYPNNDDCDVLSPGATFNNFYTASVTLRSNGKRFGVVASGPVTWSGSYDC